MERIGSLKEEWRERIGRLYPIELRKCTGNGSKDKTIDKK